MATCAKSRWTSIRCISGSLLSPPISTIRCGEAAGGQDDTYGFALTAHPGKSQGRPPTNTGSQPIEQHRPAQPRLLRDAPVPDGRTILTAPDATGAKAVARDRATPAAFHTGYQHDRGAQPPAAQGAQDQGPLPPRGRRPQAGAAALAIWAEPVV